MQSIFDGGYGKRRFRKIWQRRWVIKEYGEKVLELNNDEAYTWDISPEDDERYLMNARLAEAEERGFTKSKIEIVKNLKDKLSLEEIANVTGLSVEKVQEILKDKNE